jgi:hypothetical protein
MSSQETDHVSPTEVIPELGKGALDTWRPSRSVGNFGLGGRLDKTGTHANDGPRGEAVGKPSGAGVYTNQRLNLSKPWEGTRRTCQGLEPDPGNLAVRDFRGASRNVRHGETVNPPRNRKSRTGNPSPTAGVGGGEEPYILWRRPSERWPGRNAVGCRRDTVPFMHSGESGKCGQPAL